MVETEWYLRSFVGSLFDCHILRSETRTTRYWGGVPVGRQGDGDSEPTDSRYKGTLESEVFLYNHFNLNIAYSIEDGKYQILRFWIQPFSIQHEQAVDMVSCEADSTTHTDYDQLVTAPVQPATGLVKYTYDVRWVHVDADSIDYRGRWDVYLEMDDATPTYVELMGVVLGAFLLVAIVGVLYTWVMRDLSYKPVVGEADFDSEEAIEEVKMWPLSIQVFYPPTSSPTLLCIACGTGAQLLTSGFWFVVLFRSGIISQSQGADLLTPGAILFVLSSPVAGYVTARLYAIFHGDRIIALAASMATAIAYPLLGLLVLFLVYDVLPSNVESPNYNVLAHSQPLILLWIFMIWPLSLIGGFVGYRHGPIQNFPVSTGNSGYHDLNLQDQSDSSKANQERKLGNLGSCLRRYRIVFLFLTCGLLPVISCFVNYSYGIAAPILIGSYSVRAFAITSFCLFLLVAAALSCLVFYRQIRVHNFRWWWSAFSSAGSAGLYIFLLSMSWLLSKAESHISSNDMALYTLWFAFLAFGVTLMTGFAGVAACIWFNRTMYRAIMRRQ